jgi:hypothetical protein
MCIALGRSQGTFGKGNKMSLQANTETPKPATPKPATPKPATPKPPSKAKPPAKAKTPAPKKAKKEIGKPDNAIGVPELAEMLSKGKKERVRKSFIRKALDRAEWPKRDGKRYFLPNEIEKVRKLITDALKGE